MKKSLLFLFLFSLLFIVVSCKKDKTTTTVDPPYVPVTPVLSTSLAGLGYHGGIPSGTAWTFPANIQVVGNIVGGDPGKSPYIGKKTIEAWENYSQNSAKTNWETHGLGMFVSLYMNLHNTSASPSTFIFPAGLLFCNRCCGDTITDTTQTGLVVVPDTVTIPGGDTLRLCLKSFCSNPNRHAPTYLSVYDPAVVSNNDQVVHFIEALHVKSVLVLAGHESDILFYIWKFVGGTPLTTADYAVIAAW